MNRSDLQHLAEMRIEDAQLLLDHGRYSAAYYLAGYAVECALKACIAKNVNAYDFPDKETVINSWNHNLKLLLRTAGLEPQKNKQGRSQPVFAVNWGQVETWNESSRYKNWSEADARQLYLSITDSVDGVLPWLRLHW